jgi:hypothetical protein
MKITYSLPVRGSGEVLSGYLETNGYADISSHRVSF